MDITHTYVFFWDFYGCYVLQDTTYGPQNYPMQDNLLLVPLLFQRNLLLPMQSLKSLIHKIWHSKEHKKLMILQHIHQYCT